MNHDQNVYLLFLHPEKLKFRFRLLHKTIAIDFNRLLSHMIAHRICKSIKQSEEIFMGNVQQSPFNFYSFCCCFISIFFRFDFLLEF